LGREAPRRARPERVDALAADGPCATLPPAVPWQWPPMARPFPRLPDPRRRPPLDRAALRRTQPGARPACEPCRGLALVEPARLVRATDKALAARRPGAASRGLVRLGEYAAGAGGAAATPQRGAARHALRYARLDQRDGRRTRPGGQPAPSRPAPPIRSSGGPLSSCAQAVRRNRTKCFGLMLARLREGSLRNSP